MAWKIVSWSSMTKSGTIASPHFSGISFGPSAVPEDTEFSVNEEVVATLDGEPDNYTVRALRKVRFRSEEQPPNTADEIFSWLNQKRFGDLRQHESSTDDSLVLWAGDCCEYCSDAALVTFRSSSSVGHMDDDASWDDPYFRRATADEIESTPIPPGHRAYFVVLTEYEPELNSGFLVIASEVDIQQRDCQRA